MVGFRNHAFTFVVVKPILIAKSSRNCLLLKSFRSPIIRLGPSSLLESVVAYSLIYVHKHNMGMNYIKYKKTRLV